mmetsp:Transcript_12946/g.34413  ORF Transcript_12946/g.34413 Transcript_12946/m.34413 type:complete len:278 (+) Transcript_12946:561-1394(+)
MPPGANALMRARSAVVGSSGGPPAPPVAAARTIKASVSSREAFFSSTSLPSFCSSANAHVSTNAPRVTYRKSPFAFSASWFPVRTKTFPPASRACFLIEWMRQMSAISKSPRSSTSPICTSVASPPTHSTAPPTYSSMRPAIFSTRSVCARSPCTSPTATTRPSTWFMALNSSSEGEEPSVPHSTHCCMTCAATRTASSDPSGTTIPLGAEAEGGGGGGGGDSSVAEFASSADCADDEAASASASADAADPFAEDAAAAKLGVRRICEGETSQQLLL